MASPTDGQLVVTDKKVKPDGFDEAPELLASRTRSDAVTARLRDEIISGHLAPGEKLSQDQLAERFGVSRIPVREGLRKLAAEGLVLLRSHHSATVAELTADEIDELIAIAGTLEALGTRQGAGRLTHAGVQKMAGLLDQMESLEDRPREWYRLNVEFHMLLTRASGWGRLSDIVEETRRNIMRYVVQPDIHHALVKTWHAQHREIYAACVDRDIERIVERSDHHWRYSKEMMLSHMTPVIVTQENLNAKSA